MIEDREYDRDTTTAEEAELIRGSMQKIEAGIIQWTEIPRHTRYSLGLVSQGLERQTQDMELFTMIIDLRRATMPTAVIRQAIREAIFSRDRLLHTAVFTGRNSVLNVVARLIMSQTICNRYSVHRHRDEALNVARQKLAMGMPPVQEDSLIHWRRVGDARF
ncbi:MAG: hypothetical protein AAF799_20370 [Myxococcota bacterium]